MGFWVFFSCLLCRAQFEQFPHSPLLYISRKTRETHQGKKNEKTQKPTRGKTPKTTKSRRIRRNEKAPDLRDEKTHQGTRKKDPPKPANPLEKDRTGLHSSPQRGTGKLFNLCLGGEDRQNGESLHSSSPVREDRKQGNVGSSIFPVFLVGGGLLSIFPMGDIHTVINPHGGHTHGHHSPWGDTSRSSLPTGN